MLHGDDLPFLRLLPFCLQLHFITTNLTPIVEAQTQIMANFLSIRLLTTTKKIAFDGLTNDDRSLKLGGLILVEYLRGRVSS